MGTPGGGKSSTAAALADILFPDIGGICYLAMGREMRSIRTHGHVSIEKIFGAVWFALMHWGFVSTVLKYAITANPTITGVKRAMVLLRAMHTIDRLYRLNAGTIVMEEGVLQMVWSVAVERWRWPQAAIKSILRKLVVEYDLIAVQVSVPTEIAVARIKKRAAGGRFFHFPSDKLFAVLERGREAFASLSDMTVAVGGCLIQIDGLCPVRENVKTITNRVLQYQNRNIEIIQKCSNNRNNYLL
jgi:hypothetical protein